MPSSGSVTTGSWDGLFFFAFLLARLAYTSSSPYEQSPANDRAQLPGLSRALGCTPENCTEAYFLALRTDFLRQRNRVAGQLRRLVEHCETRLTLWQLEKQRRKEMQ